MSPTLNNDILLRIVEVVTAELRRPDKPEIYDYRTDSILQDPWAKNLLLVLRRTSRFLATSITPLFFSHIIIDQIDDRTAEYLKCICNSATIPHAIKKYTLKPNIVHTAPVVKSDPLDYYGELLGNCCGPEPRHSDLVAVHEMRQRVKAHFDEQRRFLIPDYGSVWYYLRIYAQKLVSSQSFGSALQGSCFLTAMDAFENLHEMVVSYSLPKAISVATTISEDLSIGLGRYLARDTGRQLQVLRLEQVCPSDVELLVSTMQTSKALPESSPSLIVPRKSTPGSWPLTPKPTSPGLFDPIFLQLRNLDILFSESHSTNGWSSDSPLAPALTKLLSSTINLTTLTLRSPTSFGRFDLTPTLTGFCAPPLPFLTDLTMEYIVADADAIVSLIRSENIVLQNIDFFAVVLEKGTWAEIGKYLREGPGRWKGLATLRMKSIGYLSEQRCRKDLRVEDREVLEWWSKAS